MSWYLEVWKKFAVFSGRARRKEYWMFLLLNMVVTGALFVVDVMMGLDNGAAGFGILSGIYSLAVFVPSLAVTIRRLHDSGRSGWMMLLGFIPIVGPFIVLYFMLADSQTGTNAYGPNPKASPTPVPMAA